MERKISSYSISLLLCLLIALPMHAQMGNPTDNRPVAHKKEKKKEDIPFYPLFNGIEVSLDLWGPGAYLFGSDNLSAEVAASANLKNRYFPILELGYGHADAWSDDGIHYKTGAPYMRIGMDYNFFYKKKFLHKLTGGLRYGVSSFKYDVVNPGLADGIWGGGVGNPNLEDPIWGGSLPYNHPGMKGTMHWLEACVGIRAQVWNDLYMGWSLRYKFRLSSKTGEYGDPSYVPGFGTYGSSSIGVAYTITYVLPFF